MKTVAVLGGNADIVALLVRLINQYESTQASGFLSAAEFFAATHASDLVLLSSSVSEADEKSIRDKVTIPIVQHFGGGSGLLRAEILPYLS
jgi:hypothetical protein